MHSRVNMTLLSRSVRDNYNDTTQSRRLDRDVTGILRNIVFLNVANVAYAQNCELRNAEIERISAKLKSPEEISSSESPNARQLNPLHHTHCAHVCTHVFPVRDLNIVLSSCCGITNCHQLLRFLSKVARFASTTGRFRTCRMIFNNAGQFNYSVVYSRVRPISKSENWSGNERRVPTCTINRDSRKRDRAYVIFKRMQRATCVTFP